MVGGKIVTSSETIESEKVKAKPVVNEEYGI